MPLTRVSEPSDKPVPDTDAPRLNTSSDRRLVLLSPEGGCTPEQEAQAAYELAIATTYRRKGLLNLAEAHERYAKDALSRDPVFKKPSGFDRKGRK